MAVPLFIRVTVRLVFKTRLQVLGDLVLLPRNIVQYNTGEGGNKVGGSLSSPFL
jgi:hypothetical protein